MNRMLTKSETERAKADLLALRQEMNLPGEEWRNDHHWFAKLLGVRASVAEFDLEWEKRIAIFYESSRCMNSDCAKMVIELLAK